MKLTLKIGALIIGLCSIANAAKMTGGVTLGGTYAPNDTDLTAATSIVIAPTLVVGSSGTFASEGVGLGDPASFSASNPLIFDPITLPAGALYSFGDVLEGTRFEFYLTSLVELAGTTSIKLNLFGTGYFKDTLAEYEDTYGTWNASFDNQGAQFGFSSSSTTPVPDGGATMVLLGVSLLGLHGVRRKLALR